MPYKDPDKDKAVKKAWYLAHKAQQRARQKAQRAADPEKRRAYEKIYYQAHQQHVSGIHKRYYAKNRERLLAKARELDNAKRRAQGIPPRLILTPEERPERRKAYSSAYRSARAQAPLNDLTHAQWLEIQVAQDHRCHYCGKRAKGHLTQDHITPLSKGGSHTLHNVIGACRSCNCRKQAGPPLTSVQPLLLTVAPARKRKVS